MVRAILERALQVRVEEFNDPLVALERLRKPPAPAAMLCDLRMPGMDGLTLIRAIRADGGSFPVFIVSAFATTEMEVEAAELGIRAFIEKPFQPSVLVDYVRGCLAEADRADG